MWSKFCFNLLALWLISLKSSDLGTSLEFLQRELKEMEGLPGNIRVTVSLPSTFSAFSSLEAAFLAGFQIYLSDQDGEPPYLRPPGVHLLPTEPPDSLESRYESPICVPHISVGPSRQMPGFEGALKVNSTPCLSCICQHDWAYGVSSHWTE